MLRFLLVLLLLANGLFYAWSNDYLSAWGLPAYTQRESFRLNEQIEPQRVVVSPLPQTHVALVATKTLDASSSHTLTASVPATKPTLCLTAGVFDDSQSQAIKQVFNTQLSKLRWRFEATTTPARWIVYMGKYPNNNARELKKAELNQIKVSYETLSESKLEPGLSLGNHASQAAANQALQSLAKKGVRTARVLQESPEQQGQTLIIPAVDSTELDNVNAVYAALSTQLSGKVLQACKN
jgi:hypothetical protein